MKRVTKPARAKMQSPDNEPVMNLSEVFCLLQAIEQLQDLKIEIAESANGNIQIVIGENMYELL